MNNTTNQNKALVPADVRELIAAGALVAWVIGTVILTFAPQVVGL